MKKRAILIIVVALLLNCTYILPQYRNYHKVGPMAISERVGETLDPGEREQFDLFPEVDSFKTAKFYRIAEGGYAVEILTENKKFVAVNRDSAAIILLGDYIDRYEEIQVSKVTFEEKWEIVDYDDIGQPIRQHELTKTQSKRFCCSGKGGTGCVAGGIVGCLALGVILPTLGAFNIISGDDFWEGVFWYGSIPLGVIGAVTGIWLEKNVFKNDALKAIKKSRRPRAIE